MTSAAQAPPARRFIGGKFDMKQASRTLKVFLGHVPRDRQLSVDRDPPVVIARDGERHDRGRPGPQRCRLRRPADHVIDQGLDAEVDLATRHISNLRLNHDCTDRRRLNQRARREQDGQHDAEGDGPQHDVIVAREASVDD